VCINGAGVVLDFPFVKSLFADYKFPVVERPEEDFLVFVWTVHVEGVGVSVDVDEGVVLGVYF